MSTNIYTTTLPYTNTPYTNTSAAGTYTIGVANGTSATDISWNPVTITQKPTIELKGEDADVVINGESLNETLKAIKDALKIPGILQRNELLEKEWEELKAVADHYNKLKKEYTEKQRVWDIMKK